MSIQCAHCLKTISAERAGSHSQTCKVQVSARVAEDRKARPAQYLPIEATRKSLLTYPGTVPDPEGEALQDAAREYEDEHPGAVTQGMLFGEEWTR